MKQKTSAELIVQLRDYWSAKSGKTVFKKIPTRIPRESDLDGDFEFESDYVEWLESLVKGLDYGK